MSDQLKSNSEMLSGREYETIILCSNKLTNVGQLFSINGVDLLEIQKGEVPEVTLISPALPEKPNGEMLIKSNVSYVKDLSVWADRNRKETNVSFHGSAVLEVLEINDSEVEVIELDLRGIGLNIWGSKSGLFIGNNSYKENAMRGVGVAFGIGAPRQT